MRTLRALVVAIGLLSAGTADAYCPNANDIRLLPEVPTGGSIFQVEITAYGANISFTSPGVVLVGDEIRVVSSTSTGFGSPPAATRRIDAGPFPAGNYTIVWSNTYAQGGGPLGTLCPIVTEPAVITGGPAPTPALAAPTLSWAGLAGLLLVMFMAARRAQRS